jgi:hypothetical protein
MLQKLFYFIFVFLSTTFYNFNIFIFSIIFGRTCYGTTVYTLALVFIVSNHKLERNEYNITMEHYNIGSML